LTKVALISSRLIATLVCLFCGILFSHAQHVQFLDQNLNPVSQKEGASFSRTSALQEDSSAYVEVHYLSGGLRMQGRYARPDLKVEDGHFAYFFANGIKESEGYYSQGQKTGIWKRWDWEGNVKADRVYPQLMATKESGPTVSAIYPGGIDALNSYVSGELIYPFEAAQLGIEGWVYTAFTITNSGEVKDIEVIQTSHVSLNQEARRIIKCMPHWKAALRNGAPVDSKFILPIVFDLPNYQGYNSASSQAGTN
jgi:TonB family protein